MLYQPQTFKDCQTILCNQCITTNKEICILSIKQKELTKSESKILVDKRFWEIVKYEQNRMGEIEKFKEKVKK